MVKWVTKQASRLLKGIRGTIKSNSQQSLEEVTSEQDWEGRRYTVCLTDRNIPRDPLLLGAPPQQARRWDSLLGTVFFYKYQVSKKALETVGQNRV